MVDQRLKSMGNVRFRWYDNTGFANYRWPTTAEMNAGQELEQVTLWDNFSIGSQASETSDAVPIAAKANVVRRAAANYGGNASFWYPGYRDDITNAAALVLLALEKVHTPGYLALSVDGEIGEPGQPPADFSFEDGDYTSIFKVTTDEWDDMITGEDPFYYTRNFLKNGGLASYTVVSDTAPVLALSGTGLSGAVGGMGFVTATVNGRDWTRGAQYVSSNPLVATVSNTGVVKRLATGTATITASLPGAAVTQTVTATIP